MRIFFSILKRFSLYYIINLLGVFRYFCKAKGELFEREGNSEGTLCVHYNTEDISSQKKLLFRIIFPFQRENNVKKP
ncbi:hypothetical protein ADH66_17690 [Acutalibacter muris]|uniref:Uncharacterized protein n=1 Tax=Acutalibacter muris TaxID=1796620 RepID=A0ABM6L9X8_9FIRM|nr:hypothetical protein A4V00_10755 [Hungateiclostridiaceae bacterium KB18]ASB42324.1 hypothetical protein ADH66_17690 [Acutalibacter muris]